MSLGYSTIDLDKGKRKRNVEKEMLVRVAPATTTTTVLHCISTFEGSHRVRVDSSLVAAPLFDSVTKLQARFGVRP